MTAAHPDFVLGKRAGRPLRLRLTGKAVILAAIPETSIPDGIVASKVRRACVWKRNDMRVEERTAKGELQ